MRRGVTLAELMVTLVLLGVLSGLSAAILGTLRDIKPTARAQVVARARLRAVRTGQSVQLEDDRLGGTLFLPDGRAIGPDVDYLTGAPRASR
jgi:prepilin-type N-terminal cleavage/methylation domain-containing protein